VTTSNIFPRNYTGDILNFGLAKEQYAASHPDKADRVKFVIVGDDVAVGKTQGIIVGRRYEAIPDPLSTT
jgi:dihydroxyacetone kinase